MDKILDTFYKGNSKRFGLGAWNSVKDDFNEVSKSQVIKKPFVSNSVDSSNIYTNNNFQKYNHFSPNLIRMQYFNDNLKGIEHRRNLYIQDYLENARYNVYQDQYNPLLDRRKNVQKRLENVKNKLINDEEKRLNRIQKKIEEENKFIDDLIIENEKKSEDELFRILDAKNNINNNDEISFELIKEDSESEQISNDYPKKKSILVLSRTSSKKDTSSYDDFNLLSNEDENENIVSPNRSFFSTNKTNKFPKKRAASISNNNNHKKKKHTDILKIMMNIEKYSIPVDNTSNELLDQGRQAGIIFNDMFHDIKKLKMDVKERIEKINEERINNINKFKDILFLSDNNNIRNSVDNIFFRTGQRKLKCDKNYLDSELNLFKNQIEKNVDDGIENFEKEKEAQNYEIKIKNEPTYMENDYFLRIKGNERSKYGLINVRNLYNKIDKMPSINIKSMELGNESIREFSPADTIKSNLFTFSNNSENNIFPALRGLREKISTVKSSESDKKDMDIDKDRTKKKKKKKKRKNAYVKDLGVIDEEYEGHKDHRKERKETIIDFKKPYDNEIKSNKTLVNSDSKKKESSKKENSTHSKKESITEANKSETIHQSEERDNKDQIELIINEND